AGVRFDNVIQYLNFNIKTIKGLLISHEHADHSAYVQKFIEHQIPVYCSGGTLNFLDLSDNYLVKEIKDRKQFKIGNFEIIPFLINHDALEPMGFLIRHKEIGALLFVTDTSFINHSIPVVNHILVECNYDISILNERLNSGDIQNGRYNRIIMNHMSIDNFIEFIKTVDLDQVRTLVLLHLSDRNSNAAMFKEKIMKETGKEAIIAVKGMEIPLI
ncbi:MAG: MBL fold metallo-hydrolase, partial [Chitinophagaceae bacterium]